MKDETWDATVAHAIVRGVTVALAMFAVGIGVCCWKAGPGIPTPADVDAYGAEQRGCSAGAPSPTVPDRATVDACRAASRARFCARFPTAENCDGTEAGEGGSGDGGR